MATAALTTTTTIITPTAIVPLKPLTRNICGFFGVQLCVHVCVLGKDIRSFGTVQCVTAKNNMILVGQLDNVEVKQN